jgi:protease-4
MKFFLSKIRRILSLFWEAVSVARRFVVNLLFIALVILIISIIMFERRPAVPEGVALILSPEGTIVEQKSATILSNQIFGEAAQKETLLRDIIDVIDYAKKDHRIKVLVLDLRDMEATGISKLQDIGAALSRFKDSGKRIIAYGDYYDQSQYYLAAHADRVYLNPMGGVLLYGFGLYRKYYKSALDKLRVQFHVFKVGTYKSALEPFVRDDMSENAKEENSSWLNVLWDYYRADIAAQRGLEPGSLDDYINNIDVHLAAVKGDTALLALNQGLVDELKTRDEVRSELIQLVGEEADSGTYKKIEFEDYLDSIYPSLSKTVPAKPKVGVIVAQGIILDGSQPAGTIGGDTLSDLIRVAREDDKISALVLRIDSPGGSALASEIIRHEITLTRQAGKPVVVSMGSVAASGAYWIASAADEIMASPTTLTGSIGIFGAFATFEKSLKYLGIQSDGVATTKLADAFDPSRPLNPLVADAMQQIIEQGYRLFINKVSAGRNMPPEAVEKIAEGRVWSGKTAVKLGLVDKLGNLQDAARSAADKAGLKNYEIKYIEQPLTATEMLIQRLNRLFFGFFQNTAGGNSHPSVKLVNQFSREMQQVMKLNDPNGLYAYCLTCDVQ